MLSESEITSGLVLHLDPDELMSRGGTYTCADALRVQGGHFFACLSVAGGIGRWLPLYSKPGFGRQELSVIGRKGHAKWTGGTFFWHQDQVWSATNAAVVPAAAAGRDMSRKGARNTIAVAELPEL